MKGLVKGTPVILVEAHRDQTFKGLIPKGLCGVVLDWQDRHEQHFNNGGYQIRFEAGITWWVNESAVAPQDAATLEGLTVASLLGFGVPCSPERVPEDDPYGHVVIDNDADEDEDDAPEDDEDAEDEE